MEKEKKIKEPKAPKEKKVKKSKYPEGYIGRPKPMKTKSFEFHKPTKKFWIGLVFLLAVIGFLTYIVHWKTTILSLSWMERQQPLLSFRKIPARYGIQILRGL